MTKKSMPPMGPTLELHPLTVEILAEINPLALLLGVKLSATKDDGVIGFVAPFSTWAFHKFSTPAEARQYLIDNYGPKK